MTTSRAANDGDQVREDPKLGLNEGMTIKEIGWGLDVDELFRRRVQGLTDSALVDKGYTPPVDAVLLWCRAAKNPSLRHALRQAKAALSRSGFVWLLTPTPGSPRRVHPVQIDTASLRTGFHVEAGPGIEIHRWIGTRLTRPPSPDIALVRCGALPN
ncbi:DUF3052 family protein [Rhodococcus sp. NM-2]|uniref:DUF3052 family protein n=1 Tax=Rhodococcus sp. NM-2 TaxID=3401174 RepID=UPI003AAEBE9A